MANSDWIVKYLESFDVQLENIVLCRILISKKMPPDLISEYFTGRREGFFRAIENQWINLKLIDPVILKKDHFECVDDAIKEKGSSSSAAIEQLKTLWKKRKLAELLLKSGELSNVDDILARIQQETGQIALKMGIGDYNHVESVKRLLEAFERAQTRNNEIAGFSTGLKELDFYTSGIEKGKMYCIGALKKSGKSRFAIYLSIKMREAGAGVLWNSLEMNDAQLNSCALSYFTGSDSKAFGRKMSSTDYTRSLLGVGPLLELDWTVSREKTTNALRARIIQEKNKKPIDVVIVDFIQRMCNDSKESRTKEVESIAMDLADISREQNVAVIPLSQLSGIAEHLKDDEMPNMSHMKESQGIAENADCIITLHNFGRRDNPFNEDGSYRLQEIQCLIEQRYDVSGACFRFLGDLRNCQFKNHSEPYGKRDGK